MATMARKKANAVESMMKANQRQAAAKKPQGGTDDVIPMETETPTRTGNKEQAVRTPRAEVPVNKKQRMVEQKGAARNVAISRTRMPSRGRGDWVIRGSPFG